MSWPVEKTLEEAFQLDPEDRALVVAELSSSKGNATPEEAEAAWRGEIARLLKSLEDGTAAPHEWDEVNTEISSILKGASRRLGFLPRPARSSPTRSGGTAATNTRSRSRSNTSDRRRCIGEPDGDGCWIR